MKLSDTLLYSENTSNLYIILNTNNSLTRLILSNSSKNIFNPSVSIHIPSWFSPIPELSKIQQSLITDIIVSNSFKS